VSFLDAWSRWAAGDPTLHDAHLWGLTINTWGWISQIILGLGIIALILDVRASPERHRPRRQGMSALGWLQTLVIGSLSFLLVGGYLHAIAEEARETHHSIMFVLFAGEDSIDWNGAPRWYGLISIVLVAIAIIIWRRQRLSDWLHHVRHKPLLVRLLAAIATLAALPLAVLASP
jgi:hypothetical protein